MNTIKTFEKVAVENYPYGYSLRTTLYDSIDFDMKKGYRHVTQTINPKNGRLNAPKKSTYSPLIIRYYNEDNHIKTLHFHFNGTKELNEGIKFVSENFDLFTAEEIKYIYTLILTMSIVDCKASCIYAGSKPEELKPLYTEFWMNAKKGLSDGQNYFNILVLDEEKIKATKDPNFNPFK